MIRNPAGGVAVRFSEPIQKYVMVGKHEYVFTPRKSVSIAWVAEEDVDALLGMRQSGCCGAQGKRFFLANEESVNLWLHGRR